MLTLHFTLPLKTPVKAKDLTFEVYDREFFVDFSFAKKDPAKLVGAPAKCKLTVGRPQEMGAALTQAAEPARPRPEGSHADHRRRIRQQDFGEMSVRGVAEARLPLAKLVVAVAVIALVAGAADVALAQGGPFGVPRPQARPARASRRRGRLDSRQAGGVLQAVLRPHSRRQGRRQRRLDACSACPFSTASFTPPVPATARR